jgi:large subunit ribosomal protein L20
MPRVKRGVTSHHKHKKILELTKGQRSTKHRLVKRATEAMIHSLNYAYFHRKERKGDFRRLWIQRVNAACRAQGMTYSQFMHGLKVAGVDINRKNLADMAVMDAQGFSNLVTLAGGKGQE